MGAEFHRAEQGAQAQVRSPRLLSIVCPVFREAETIDAFHAALLEALEPLRARYEIEILYVVDPSDDGTELRIAAIADASSKVTAIIMSRRFGHQAALLAGIEESAGDAVVMLDSDLQHPPGLIAELVRRWEEGAEIVQTLRREDPSAPWLRRTTSRLFYQLLLRIGSIDIPAGAADFRLISARVATTLRDELPERNPFLRGLFSWVGFNVCYVAYDPAPRLAGASKYRVGTLFTFALNGIFSFSKVPLRMCIAAGTALALVSFVFTLMQVVMYWMGNRMVPGWASLFGAVGIIGGIQLLFLGVIGEYLSIIFDEVKHRPRYLIERRIGAVASKRVSGPVPKHAPRRSP
ncbi:MAG: glycosyltransferase family 2 protein [Casimicrobiaceae bacterium]